MGRTFLGIAASEGYPDASCGCADYDRAGTLGWTTIRHRSTALLDGELLLDLGPDMMAAATRQGGLPTRVAHGLLTHEHPDHLDASDVATGRVGVGRRLTR